MNFELHMKSLEIVSTRRSLLIRLNLVSKCLDKSVCQSVCCPDSSFSKLRVVCIIKHFAPTQITALELSKEKTNLMPLILLFIQYSFNAQHVSAVNTTIFRSLPLAGCYFMGGIWFWCVLAFRFSVAMAVWCLYAV